MDKSSDELKQVNAKVTSNSASIKVLKNSVEILETRKDKQTASPPNSLSSSSGCSGASIEEALAKQTRFNTALSLGHSPTMFFGGELHKYVQFVTMFRNSFDKTINDSVALYKILLRHDKGPAKAAIESCIFSVSSTDRYEEAMTILKETYDQKNGVIRSRHEELLNGKPITDSIADFEVLSNELKCFHSVLIHYNVNM